MDNIQYRLKNLSPEKRALIEKQLREKALQKAEFKKIPVRKDTSSFPMSFNQERLWFLSNLNPHSTFYNIPAILKLSGRLNYSLLESTINKVLDRHEILNVIFVVDKGSPKQILFKRNYKLEIINSDAKDKDEFIQNELAESFDLGKGPLYKIRLIRISDTEHILLFILHHIITDGWSVTLLINEITNFYNLKNNSADQTLVPLDIQYFDYAEWQHENYKNGKLNHQLEYWIKKLEHLPQIIGYQTDKKRPSVQTYVGDKFEFSMDKKNIEKLKKIGQVNKLSPFMIFYAAFELLLLRFSGEEDFAIGIPAANRKNDSLKNLVGFFVNTLAIRSTCTLDLSLNEFFASVKEKILEAFENQDIPFEKVVEAVVHERSPANSPLFQVMFDYQDSPLKHLVIDDLEIDLVDISLTTAKFDLLLTIEDRKDYVVASFEYNTDLFFRDSIDNLSKVYRTILESIADGKSKNISDVNIIPKDQLKLFDLWNKTQTPYPRSKSVCHLFEEISLKYPKNTAITWNEQILSYKQLNKKVNYFYSKLKELSIGKGSHVSVYLEQSSEMIIAFLAILKCGAVYVPLDIAYPPGRINFMLDDTSSKLLISSRKLDKTELKDSVQKLYIEDLNFNEAADYPQIPENIAPEDPAYIIYTSGSTGRPKGVVVPHKAIVRLVRDTNYIDISENDVIAQISNASFDAATFEIWGSLLNGATLSIINKEKILSYELFYELLRKYKISVLFITSSLFNQYAKYNSKTFSELRSVYFGGEAADPESVKIVFDANSSLKLYNAYGPTENTTFSTYHLIKDKDFSLKSLPIGKAISNTTLYVTDINNRLLPVGFPGELFIGGDGLALGYFKREELNKDRFIPAGNLGAGKLYKSGDLVRFLSDGSIEFLGRKDKQIKLRGFRIELGEIESSIKKLKDIDDCAVILHGNNSESKKLVVYYVAQKNINSEKLKLSLQNTLPEYMIPGVFIKIPQIPITPNGKLDRKTLSKLLVDSSDQNRKYVAPRNSLERYLADLWKDVLRLEKVGVYDNFFEVGGNSLKAAILMNRMEQDFKASAHISAIFKAPYIAEFANYVAEYYPEFVMEKFSDANYKSKLENAVIGYRKIDDEKINKFRSLIISNKWTKNKRKNKKAIFLLSPPRSGSTLLRVMLAGNNSLFSPPELDLLSFDRLQDRKKFFIEKNLEIWTESTIRAIMELKDCDLETATKIMNAYEERNISTLELFSEIQKLAGNRIVVDKTPSYSLDMNILNRIEDEFDEPLFIHLLRNPYPMIYSFIEAKLDKHFFKYENPFTRQELAELIWLISHQNILELKQKISLDRYYPIKFENLLVSPKEELERLSSFLKIEFNEDMLKPYSGKKMTTGITPDKQMVGDFKFYLRNKIDTNVIHKWKNFHRENFLSDETKKLAVKFGYSFGEINKGIYSQISEVGEIQRTHRNERIPLSSSQKRLWFLEQLEGPSSNYNIVSAVEILGDFKVNIAEKCLKQIVNRHEVFRTAFKTIDGKPIASLVELNGKIIKTLDLTSSVNIDGLDQLITNEAIKPFDISEPPLFRFTFIKIKNDKFIFVVSLHHIISDGWSIGILIKEFTEIYEANIHARNPDLEELTIQYSDYAEWHNNELLSERFVRKLEYWKNKLKGVDSIVTFPPDLKRPLEQKHRGDRIYFELDGDLFNKVKEISKNQNVTPYVILLSVYAILLSRYSNQNDLTIGTPIAGRNKKEIEPLIGFFANTVILRIKIDENSSFTEIINNIKDDLVDIFENNDYPFEKLVELVESERNMSYSPIFQTMFAYNDTALESINIENIKIKPLKIDTNTSKFDLTFEFVERKNDFKVAIEFNIDLYRYETILRLFANFNELLNTCLNNREMNILNSKYISDDEIKLLDEFSTGKSEINNLDENFVSLFEKQALDSADCKAVIFENTSLIYSDLNTNANKIAEYIVSKSENSCTSSEKPIGVLLERSVELIETILGILKAGNPYLPIDPEYPQSRIKYIINDSKINFIITQSKFNYLFEEMNLNVIYIDTEWETINKLSGNNLNRVILPQNLAYIIYTSGSTGNPKGVSIQHSSVINLYNSLNERIYKHFNGNKVNVSLNAPIQFDASVQQLVQLLSGHTLVIIPQHVKNDIELFNNYIREKKIDVLDCVPTQLKLLITSELFDKETRPAICLPGGEAIDQNLWNECLSKKSTKFFNMYGPTESTVDITIGEINELNDIPSLGKCVNNTKIHILDRNLNKVPIGVIGELFIEGTGLACGYFNDPHRTAEVFIPNPFTSELGGRLYKTGDLGKYDHNGNLIYIGRTDHQIKLRGYRIELGEIEANLKKHPLIKDALVVLNKDSADKILAYVMGEKEKIGTNELKKYLRTLVPEYMIPSGIMFVEKFLLTPNGKVDRNRLPKFEISREELDNKYNEPKTEKEVQLAEILKKLLNIKKVGIEDNFFELGGDSILSIQLVSEARNRGILLKPKNVFQYPTIKGMLTIAEKTKEQKIEIGSLEGEFPLTPIQSWFFEQEFNEPDHWNQSLLLEFEKSFDHSILKKTINFLYDHHDSLRMRFKRKNNKWYQFYSDKEVLPFEIKTIDFLNKSEIEDEISKEADIIQASLSITQGPLVRFVYIETQELNYILIVAHHLIIDGVSWRILTDDLQKIYSQLESGVDLILPQKTSTVGLWSKLLLEYSGSEKTLNDLNFWNDQKIKQGDNIKINEKNIINTQKNADYIDSILVQDYTLKLIKEIPNKYNTDISEFLLTALVRANSNWRGERKLSVTLESHGRENISDKIDLSRTVGWFTSLYPIVLDLQDSINPIDSLKLIKEQLRKIPQNGISYGILKYYNKNININDLPHLSEISFNYLGQFILDSDAKSRFKINEECKGIERASLNKRSFQLDFIASIIKSELHIKIIYNQNIWSNNEMNNFVNIFMNELKLLIDISLSDSGGYTPSDFSNVELEDQDLDNIISEINEDLDND